MITKTWIGGLAAFAVGILAALVGAMLMLGYGGTLTQVAGSEEYTFTPDTNGFFWTSITIIIVGGAIATIGVIVQLVAFVGALINSYALPEKTWFTILLIGGVLGLAVALVGFAVMVAYLIAAPEGLPDRRTQAAVTVEQPAPLVPTR
jgi:hypothetical protein